MIQPFSHKTSPTTVSSAHHTVQPLPAKPSSERRCFLTILKLREIKRRRPRLPEA